MLRTSYGLVVVCFSFSLTPLLAQDTRFTSGNIQVKRQDERDEKGAPLFYNLILRDQINFGYCFEEPKHRRMAVTYYHPHGPVGMVFKKYDWFAGKPHTYDADARLPASLAALGAVSPMAQLAACWSEPPVCVIGMNVGTPAAYARPLQCLDFYEPTKAIIELNERNEDRFFHFIPDAVLRGAHIRIKHGAPRKELKKNGPQKFYRLMILEACSGENGEKIFLEFFTKEGIAQCMEHLADDGILCVHTSHRFVDMPPVLAAIAADLKLHVRRGHDQAPDARRSDGKLAEMGHFSSEWVMIARDSKILDVACKTPENYEEAVKRGGFNPIETKYWSEPTPIKSVWTDDGPNPLHGVLRAHPFAMRYSAVMNPVAEALGRGAEKLGFGIEVQRHVFGLSQMPRIMDEFMVREQLKNHPDVRHLWDTPPVKQKTNP
jgi:hypothetical protein